MSYANLCIDSQEGGSCRSNFDRCWRQLLKRWYQNWRTRRQLVQLDSYQLKDIGISPSQAQQEAAKPFWRD